MLLSIEGEEKSGKTTVAYTAPLPIVGFSFDLGSKRALLGTKYDEYFKDLDIKIHRYDPKKLDGYEQGDITIYELPQPVQLDDALIAGCSEQWHWFINKAGEAINSERVRTIVVDTMTLARRIKADAYLQELQENAKQGSKPRKQLLQIEYGHANDSIRNIYTACQGTEKNLVATHHLTDERKDGVDKDGTVVSMLTGKKILEGLAQTYRYIDVALRMGKSGDNVYATIMSCGYNLALEGKDIPNPTWDRLVSMITMSLGDRLELETRNGYS